MSEARAKARAPLAAVGVAATAAAAWGHFEAGWVRLRGLECPVPELPPELEGIRIAHLADFHLGVPSRGRHAVERAVDWVASRDPDLVCITGDLLSHPRGHAHLRRVLERVPGAFVVWGNHDFGIARDPFAKGAAPYDVMPARLLEAEGTTIELRGCRVQLVGVHPLDYEARRARPDRLADERADVRILLSHYPRIVDRIEPGAFQLVLSGHLHDGQITIPYVFGKLRLAHPRARYFAGIYSVPGGTLHVSPGLGTTFVPFRFFARPEATELVLRPAEAS